MTNTVTKPKKHLILLDLDGVICDDSHRVQYAVSKNWGAYFAGIHADIPLQDGVDLAHIEHRDFNNEVQYLTGRRIDLYKDTVRWLRKHSLPNPEKVTMRGFAHRDVLAKFKAGVIKNALEGGEFLDVVLYEDDPEVVRYVNEQFGEGTAILCTWYTKNPEMVKKAEA